jgi:hypothetical protein
MLAIYMPKTTIFFRCKSPGRNDARTPEWIISSNVFTDPRYTLQNSIKKRSNVNLALVFSPDTLITESEMLMPKTTKFVEIPIFW